MLLMNDNPIIDFRGYKIQNLEYTRDKEVLSKYEKGFNYAPEVGIDKELKHGLVTLKVALKPKGVNMGIKLKISGQFDISDTLDSKEKISEALFINGTAIMFPYVRSIISMISGLDSSNTILLPTINTMDLLKNKNSED
ncbi:hypothetical protein [Companilactobacillus zhachilii]|uniref:hypothetical protein n=1 Tax=Companilactobacillus zhachilii TaxID=2304606 RepID=UPI00403364B9